MEMKEIWENASSKTSQLTYRAEMDMLFTG